MSNEELQTALMSAEYTLKAAQADYTDLRVTLEKQGLDLQSQRRASVRRLPFRAA